MGADIAQARHGDQQFGGLSKGFEPEAHLFLDLGDGHGAEFHGGFSMNRRSQGFTLLELLVVMVIIGLLAS